MIMMKKIGILLLISVAVRADTINNSTDFDTVIQYSNEKGVRLRGHSHQRHLKGSSSSKTPKMKKTPKMSEKYSEDEQDSCEGCETNGASNEANNRDPFNGFATNFGGQYTPFHISPGITSPGFPPVMPRMSKFSVEAYNVRTSVNPAFAYMGDDFLFSFDNGVGYSIAQKTLWRITHQSPVFVFPDGFRYGRVAYLGNDLVFVLGVDGDYLAGDVCNGRMGKIMNRLSGEIQWGAPFRVNNRGALPSITYIGKNEHGEHMVLNVYYLREFVDAYFYRIILIKEDENGIITQRLQPEVKIQEGPLDPTFIHPSASAYFEQDGQDFVLVTVRSSANEYAVYRINRVGDGQLIGLTQWKPLPPNSKTIHELRTYPALDQGISDFVALERDGATGISVMPYRLDQQFELSTGDFLNRIDVNTATRSDDVGHGFAVFWLDPMIYEEAS